ncbi:hypothetical protein PG985_014699 [Apiospora marii]|uniref:Uncharacterized protein n=1 Tax=Apiospora marii TaxID=335849 RepID=A0ABR1R488_9PEZI
MSNKSLELWKRYALGEFQVAFLDHKLHIIQMVNAWLNDPDLKHSAQCIRIISSLCLVEACYGDIDAARAHNQGLLQLLSDRKLAEDPKNVNRNQDVLHRFVFVVQILIHCLISDPVCARSYQYACARLYRSDLLRLLPYLLRVASREELELDPNVNAEPVHGCVGVVASKTHGFVHVLDGMALLDGGRPVAPGGLLELTWTFARLHVASLEDAVYGGVREDNHVRRVPDLPTTWSSLVTISSLFWRLVMDAPGDGLPVDAPLAAYVVEIAIRNLTTTLPQMTNGTCDRDMWFWKAFTNAMILARGGPAFLEATPAMRDADQAIARLIQAWSRATGVLTWCEAKKTLHRVVWYYNGPETVARGVWDKNTA